MPNSDRDLLFYLESQKFKILSHLHADEELLRRKVKSINDCYLDSMLPPSVQIDASNDVVARTARAAQVWMMMMMMLMLIDDDHDHGDEEIDDDDYDDVD